MTKKKKSSEKSSEKITTSNITNNITKKDINRWSAYFGAGAILLAVIVSLASSVLWIIGVSAMMFAFREKLDTLRNKKTCKTCGVKK